MVIEMTSLQGFMGGHYAKLSGEDAAVSAAIAGQYYAVSKTKPGLALAIADRLDSLTGLFSAGLMPKGSNDPFALRRAALQLIDNLIQHECKFDVRDGLIEAAKLLPIACSDEQIDEALGFINGRLEGVLREQGFVKSVVAAILAEQGRNPFKAARDARSLSDAMKAHSWSPVLDAYARCVRMTRDLPEQFEFEPSHFSSDPEQKLLQVYQTAVSKQNGTLASVLSSMWDMVPAITSFFDNVLVMDEDTAVRNNRLALLQQIAALPQGLADLSKLEGF